MKWSKRLKWLRISKIVIPIALAVTLVFAGFSVYGNEAQNFVIRTQGVPEVRLSVSNDYNLENLATVLQIPLSGASTDATFKKSEAKITAQNPKISSHDINDIAMHKDISEPFVGTRMIGRDPVNLYVAFSFMLYNGSARAVDYDMEMTFESFIHNDAAESHIEDALRIMVIDDEHYISENTYTVYAKAEKSEENLKVLNDNADYYSAANPADSVVSYFEDEALIFKRKYTDFPAGAKRKYTVVMWLEGWDVDCKDEIFGEKAKMSIDFFGY